MKVGRTFSVPDERLSPRVVEWTRRVYRRFGSAEADSLVVAQALGHASVGGAFNSKVAVMASYGVIERRQGKIRVTDIGRMIVSPRTAGETIDGVRSSLFKISLWQRLHREYTSRGQRIPPNLAPELAKISGISVAEARNKADWIAKAYAADFGYLESLKKGERERETEAGATQTVEALETGLGVRAESLGALPGTEPGGLPSQIVFISQKDQIQISVPRSAKHVAMLKAFIESALGAIEEDLTKPSSGRERQSRQRQK